jgi:hypothetical protein
MSQIHDNEIALELAPIHTTIAREIAHEVVKNTATNNGDGDSSGRISNNPPGHQDPFSERIIDSLLKEAVCEILQDEVIISIIKEAVKSKLKNLVENM